MPATTTMAETSDRRPVRLLHSPPLLQPAQVEQQQQLRCPRCDSTNTKFCYYNNYNLSQPRHFCKNCRRYWTKGGALRNIPVGGGSRKSSAKRHRSVQSATSDAAPSPASSLSHAPEVTALAPAATSLAADFGFCPLLPSSAAAYGGFLALGAEPLLSRTGLGLGFAPPGLEEMMSFGLAARAVFPAQPSPELVNSAGNTWQLSSGGEGFADAGDCFSWPELAISAPGKGLP